MGRAAGSQRARAEPLPQPPLSPGFLRTSLPGGSQLAGRVKASISIKHSHVAFILSSAPFLHLLANRMALSTNLDSWKQKVGSQTHTIALKSDFMRAPCRDLSICVSCNRGGVIAPC